MEESSFFNDVDGDRIYYAEDFAEYFIPFFTNGIFNNDFYKIKYLRLIFQILFHNTHNHYLLIIHIVCYLILFYL